MAESLAQEFQQIGERVLRRSTISQGLNEEKSLSEIRHELKAKQPKQERLIRNLSEQVINPDPRQLVLTELIYKELKGTFRNRFPEVVACGLGGSGALGGSLMRRETGVSDNNADYDCFLVLEPDTSADVAAEVLQKARPILTKLLKKNDPRLKGLTKELHFCSAINFRNFYVEDLRKLDDKQRRDYLEVKSLTGLAFGRGEALLTYIMPTYPPEVGEENKRIFLDILGKMQPEEWRKYSEQLKDLWKKSIAIIKKKHVLPKQTISWDWNTNTLQRQSTDLPEERTAASLNRDVMLAVEAENYSSLVAFKCFVDLIDSTKPNTSKEL